jgi:HEAT repeat protein
MFNLPSLTAVALALSFLSLQSPEANEAYRRGREALDRGAFREAVAAFVEAGKDPAVADAALYWQAYSFSKLSETPRALELVAELEKRFPQSAWRDDAQALAAEIRGPSKSPTPARAQSAAASDDEDVRLMALNGLVQADEEQAIPILEELLSGTGSPRLKERALFVLAQSESEKAQEILARVARNENDPDLQRKAIRYLGVHAGERGTALLAELYRSLTTAESRSAVLDAFMVAGEKSRLLELAKSEPDADLRQKAIHLLGTMDASTELRELFQKESSPEVKKAILQAFMVSGSSDELLAVAKDPRQPEDLRGSAIHLLGAQGANDALWDLYRGESSIELKKQILRGLFVGGEGDRISQVAKSPDEPLELRKTAIQSLGTMGKEMAPALVALYRGESSRELKEQALNGLFIQGAAAELIDIARTETDPELKKAAVHWISLTGSPEAKDFLMELLRK